MLAVLATKDAGLLYVAKSAAKSNLFLYFNMNLSLLNAFTIFLSGTNLSSLGVYVITFIFSGKSFKNIPCFFSRTRTISYSSFKYLSRVISAVSIPPKSNE